MKIPWMPVTTGGGSFSPVEPTKSFLENYSSAANPISHKAFQNLPLETACPAVKIEYVNKQNKKTLQSTKIREAVDGIIGGAGEQYIDSFITKPIQGNYQGILLDLERQRIDTQKALKDANDMATLAQVANAGYRNLSETADEERMNSLRDRLRFAGASNEEIEEILKERKKEHLMAKIKMPLSPEQKQVMMGEEMYQKLTQEKAKVEEAYRPPADANVFNFSNPGAAAYASVNEYSEPGNEIFAGRANAGVNPAGPGYAAAAFASKPSWAHYLRQRQAERRVEPIIEIPARPMTDIVPVIGKAPNIMAGSEVPRPKPFPLLRPVGLRQPRLVMTPLGEKVLRQRVAPSVPLLLEDIKPEHMEAGAEVPAEFGVVQKGRGRPKGAKDIEPRIRPTGMKYVTKEREEMAKRVQDKSARKSRQRAK